MPETSMPLPISAIVPLSTSLVQNAAALITPTASSSIVAASLATSNIRTDAEGLPYSTEQAGLVSQILAASKSHYAALQITESASLSDIKQAYRKLARQVHPDKNRAPGAHQAFQLIGHAYSVLSNLEQRAAYDAQAASQRNANQDTKPAAEPTPSHTDIPRPDFDVYEIFRQFFASDDVDEVPVEMEEPDWQNQKDSLEQMFDEQVANQLVDIPAYDMPPQFTNLKLFDYQVKGIRWLIHQERRTEIPSWFTQEGPRTWRDQITGSTFQQRPHPVRGGILADGKSSQLRDV